MSVATDIFQIFEAAATVIAIIVGGYWTYMLFVKRRIDFPRANITQQVTHRAISNGKLLVHVDVIISNVGDMLLQLESGGVGILQIVPLPDAVLDSFKKGTCPVKEGQTVVDWPPVGQRPVTWKKAEFEIEPGETDQVNFDFFLNPGIETVQVYSYFNNARKLGRKIGWGQTTMYDLKLPPAPAEPLIPEAE